MRRRVLMAAVLAVMMTVGGVWCQQVTQQNYKAEAQQAIIKNNWDAGVVVERWTSLKGARRELASQAELLTTKAGTLRGNDAKDFSGAFAAVAVALAELQTLDAQFMQSYWPYDRTAEATLTLYKLGDYRGACAVAARGRTMIAGLNGIANSEAKGNDWIAVNIAKMKAVVDAVSGDVAP